MKTRLLFFLLLITSTTAFAQDVIVRKDGSTVLCKVIEVWEDYVTYKEWSDLEGQLCAIDVSDIQQINYQNGEKDVFSQQTVQTPVVQKQRLQENLVKKDVPLISNTQIESTNLSADDYAGTFGLFYSSSFEEPGEGIYGLGLSMYWGKNALGGGFYMSGGLNFKSEPSVFNYRIGPSICYVLTKNCYIELPLCLSYGETSINKYAGNGKVIDFSSKAWGATLSPTLTVNILGIPLSLSMDFSWVDGADKIGTGFTVKIL